MRSIMVALWRAILSQLSVKMLLLTILPVVLSLIIWSVLLSFGLQPMIDWLQAYFTNNDGFRTASGILEWLNLGSIKTVLVPLLAMWVLLPLMILTALVVVGTMAMPIVAKHVGNNFYPELEKFRGGSWLGTLWISSYSFVIFLTLWVVTFPLSFIPPLTFVIQPLLWGWLTCKVMAYDALAEHASPDEYKAIVRQFRWPLLLIGCVAGVLGAAPTLLWLGGPLSVVFFPVLAALAIWLYVLIFIFSGLWFEHYCLEALAEHRKSAGLCP